MEETINMNVHPRLPHRDCHDQMEDSTRVLEVQDDLGVPAVVAVVLRTATTLYTVGQ